MRPPASPGAARRQAARSTEILAQNAGRAADFCAAPAAAVLGRAEEERVAAVPRNRRVPSARIYDAVFTVFLRDNQTGSTHRVHRPPLRGRDVATVCGDPQVRSRNSLPGSRP